MPGTHVDSKLLAYVEGLLTETERRDVTGHLARCRRCAERAVALRRSHEALEQLTPSRLPPERVAAIRRQLRGARPRRLSAVRPRPAMAWARASAWRLAAPAALALVLVVAGLVTSELEATPEWSQWRGPLRDGKSYETGLLESWPEDGPPLVWEVEDLGRGFASVAVADGRVITLGDRRDGQSVLALDATDGELAWATRIGPSARDEYLGPRATPTVAQGRVFALSTDGVLVALDASTGRELWRRDLPEELGGRLMRFNGRQDWRWSESPLVDGERVIVTPGGFEAALVAFDTATGRERWRSVLPPLGAAGRDGAAYASAVISEAAGVRQVVQLVGRGLVGVEASTGRFLWGYNRVANDVANISTPIVSADYVFASTGYGTGAVLLELVARGDGVAAREVYFLGPEILQNHHGGMILHEGYVYAGSGHNRGRPVCIELRTGRRVWGPERLRGLSSAAVAFADGRLYFRHQNGRMVLVEASPEGYRERGSFQLPGPRRASFTHPVIADGRLYLRDQGRLYAYDVRQGG